MTVAVRVIPCLDVDGGRVVKGVNFRDLRDAGDPVELAALYDAEGADELTFLDITASSGGRQTMYDVVRRTAGQVFIPLTVGGGVRSCADVDALLRAASPSSDGRAIAAVFSDTLSAPDRSRASTSAHDRTPPPTVSGMNTCPAVRRTTSYMVCRPPLEAVMSRNVSSSAPSASYSAASSTGSPASRRSRKFTPLTTRPPSTSRQGMTRTATVICCRPRLARPGESRQEESRSRPAPPRPRRGCPPGARPPRPRRAAADR